ncbi:hypothetical protein [Acetobacterium wieringae]|uniref:hypothetical protein n=1 Tax=Acetobacterium wieringae TaxID=52694 RepID=UPI0020344707|nr:hypothetical protein [Acetobacterium wieringae]URN84996.1 hypothetical protein CHL1_000610 [Acetobacterium wieringae]
MLFIKTNSDNQVTFIHYKPFDEINGLKKTETELLKEGFLVESLPAVEEVEGKNVIYFYTQTGGFSHEYFDVPKTKEQIYAEKLDQLENQTAEYMVDLDFRLSNIELGL